MKAFHVGVAAEAFAAGLLAQAGCDVSVQYGANQPDYDLIATQGDRFLKISVKGSQDLGWGLVQSYKSGRTYAGAIDAWVAHQNPHIVFCLVQFGGVQIGECPRVYLATVPEIARQLKSCRRGHGTTILYERHEYRSGVAAGASDILPAAWRFSAERLGHLFKRAA
jgi:hypothetical protein